MSSRNQPFPNIGFTVECLATMMDIDVIDAAESSLVNENGHPRNGYIDPSEMQHLNDLNQTDGSPDTKSEVSEASEVNSPAAPRKIWRPTGCCYDDRMKLHANAEFSMSKAHPEDPRRIEAIMSEFKEAGLIFTGSDSDLEVILRESPTRWMYRIAARSATMPEVCTVHLATHYRWVESLSQKPPEELRDITATFDIGRKSLYVGNLTYEAALISAGGAIETCKNVVAGHVKNAIAIIRPPGHHAEHNDSLGFCIFNNVSIAARVCQADYPETCRKILILDWDVHHGNGIQNIFYEDPNVLYISLHVYQDGQFYPGQPEDESIPDGGPDKCGLGPGIGKNINIGWHDRGMGDAEYMVAFERIVMPIAREFDPDFVIVAAGFDAAAGDDLGGCFVTPPCYAQMTHMLMSLADGKIAICLEGGYDLRAISKSALAVAKTLMGEPPERITIPQIMTEASIVLDEVRDFQAPYWECMRPGPHDLKRMNKKKIKKEVQELNGVRLSVVIRSYQRRLLSQQFGMISLFVQRERISHTFEDQVLATQNLYSARKILFIIHDPPDLLALPDPIEHNIEAHNTWITDGILPYLAWAVKNGFGVLDVNIPVNHIREDDDETSVTARATEAELQLKITELVCYLWDNYLEGYESSEIIIMGVGYSYLGVKLLLTSRECKAKISAVINFVTGSLRPVRSETDSTLSTWYKTHSRVFVAADHACWQDDEYVQRVRKNRFGRVVKSDAVGLNRMLRRHYGEVIGWLGASGMGAADSMSGALAGPGA